MKSFDLFDSHLHIIDERFPLIENKGYLPEEFTCEAYLKRLNNYSLVGGAVVSGSFQGFDQSYLAHALQVLGPNFVGVTQVPATISDEEIMALNDIGVRAVRFNLKRGGSETIHHLTSMAQRVYELAGWHVELYIDSSELANLSSTISKLPAASLDHLGLSKIGFKDLLRLVEKGVKVKATGFGRVDFDVMDAIRQIYSINPTALMFGTDLPSTRAPTPYQDSHFEMLARELGDSAAKQIFFSNAYDFYKPLSKVP